MMLDKKQTQEIFLFKFKMGGKTAAKTTHNINNIFDPETANQHIVQWCFKKFYKGDESLEDEPSGWASEADNDQLRAITEAYPLTTTREVAKELNIDHSTVIQCLKEIGKVKDLHKWVTHELTENFKKIIVLKSCHLLFCTTNLFSIGL